MSTLDLLSPEEAAIVVGVSTRRIHQFCKEGRLGQRVGGVYVIPRKDAVKFAKKPRPTGQPGHRK